MKDTEKTKIALQRLYANGILKPFDTPMDCVRNLAGIQSQFQQFAEVSIRNRCRPVPTTTALSQLYDVHEIINVWGQRHTLHMYVKDDWDLVCEVYWDKTWGKKYRELFPEEFDALHEEVKNLCLEKNGIPKKDLLERLTDKVGHRLSEEDYFHYAFVRFCCINGLFFGLPSKPSIKTFIPYRAIREDKWTESENGRAQALKSLMRRYFAYYGPATLADFSHWSGLPVRLSIQVFEDLDQPLHAFTHSNREYHTAQDLSHIDIPEDELLLLGKFDPLFVSYRHKDWIATEKQAREIWKSAARVEAVVLEGVSILGTWRHSMKGKKLSLNVAPMAKIPARSRKKIATQAEKLAAFWNKQLDEITYA